MHICVCDESWNGNQSSSSSCAVGLCIVRNISNEHIDFCMPLADPLYSFQKLVRWFGQTSLPEAKDLLRLDKEHTASCCFPMSRGKNSGEGKPKHSREQKPELNWRNWRIPDTLLRTQGVASSHNWAEKYNSILTLAFPLLVRSFP